MWCRFMCSKTADGYDAVIFVDFTVENCSYSWESLYHIPMTSNIMIFAAVVVLKLFLSLFGCTCRSRYKVSVNRIKDWQLCFCYDGPPIVVKSVVDLLQGGMYSVLFNTMLMLPV